MSLDRQHSVSVLFQVSPAVIECSVNRCVNHTLYVLYIDVLHPQQTASDRAERLMEATNTSWICGYGVHYVIGCLNIPRQVDSLSAKTNGTAAEILLEQK